MRLKAIPIEPKWWQFRKRRQLKKDKKDAEIATVLLNWKARQHVETFKEYLKRVHKVTWDKRKKKWRKKI